MPDSDPEDPEQRPLVEWIIERDDRRDEPGLDAETREYVREAMDTLPVPFRMTRAEFQRLLNEETDGLKDILRLAVSRKEEPAAARLMRNFPSRN